jgi:hypothetical protein
MNTYMRNRNCPCVRCRTQGMMGAAILITVGVLLLLETYGVMPFDRSFPILLLVIGSILLISRTGSTDGHIDPTWSGPAMPPPSANPQQWTSGVAAPPPSTSNEPTDPQVKP